MYFSEGGFPDSLSTCSLVAGLWSCMYALGEVLGPSLSGVLVQHVGFAMAATIQAGMSFTLAIICFIYFTMRSSCVRSDRSSDSGISGSSWKSSISDSDERSNEKQPLLGGDDGMKRDSSRIMYTTEKEGYETPETDGENYVC